MPVKTDLTLNVQFCPIAISIPDRIDRSSFERRGFVLTDFFLYTITILSGLITIVTGGITIVGYFQHKSVSPSQPGKQSTLQYDIHHQVNIHPSQQYISTIQQPSKHQNRLSHSGIALIALIAQVLLFFAVAGFTADSVKSGQYNPFNIICFIAFLCGEACAITALVMSLLKTRQLHRWGWFTGLIAGFIGLFIVFLPALIPLLSGIFGPRVQREAKTQAVYP
jgi:hypothetical protein